MSESEKKKRAGYRRARKCWIAFLTVLLVLCLLATAGCALIYRQLSESYYIDYTEEGKVDYRVKLLPNNFYEETELAGGQSYIAMLIDTVVADFDYELHMGADNVEYEYSYKMDTELKITDNQSKATVLSRNYPVVAQTPVEKTKGGKLQISKSVDINYKEYNDFAQSFVDTMKLGGSTTSVLIVRLHVQVISACEEFEEDASNEYVVALQIPLVKSMVNIQMTTSVPEAESKILACDKAPDAAPFKKYALYCAGGDAALAVILLLVIYLTRNKDINYAIKVRKLLSAYRSFIQKINNEFNASAYQVISVSSFKEMLEIRDTIQSPVLMYENEDLTCTKFFIPTNTNLLYLFEIKVEDYDEIYGITPAPVPTSVTESAVGEPVAEKAVSVFAPAAVSEPAAAPEVEAEAEPALVPRIEVEPVAEPVIEAIAEPAAELAVEAEDDDALGYASDLDYSFEAKLALATDEVKNFYREVVAFARSYGVKVARSWQRERIYLGRKLFALLNFKGKKLVIALALDPATHADPKYHAKDMSGSRKYEKTPMLMRITSQRKVKYAIELLAMMFAENGLEHKNLDGTVPPIAHKSKRTLVLEGLIKTKLHPDTISDAVPAAVAEEATPEPEFETVDELPAEEFADVEPIDEATDATTVTAGGKIDFAKLDYSFEAKLSLATDEMKGFYREVVSFARSFGVKVTRSWQRERIHLGRNLFALLVFKGQKLSIALALDPDTHADPKYHAKDLSGSRKYDKTPMLMRITSPRKVKYATELLTLVFTEAGLVSQNLVVQDAEIVTKTKEQLLEENLIRVERTN